MSDDKQAQKEKEERKRELQDLRDILALDAGKRLFWRFFEETGLFHNPFTGNSGTFFKCGEQKVGQWLLAEVLEVDPDALTKILTINKGK